MGREFRLVRLRTGTLPWLLNHELRLWWRNLQAKWFLLLLGMLLGGMALAIALLWLVADAMNAQMPITIPNPIPLPVLQICGGIWVFLLVYSFIQAMQQSLIALFDRGDLHLMVASPISPKTIFASRLVSVALQVFLSILVLAVPASLLFISMGWFRLLGIYPSLIALCLLTTSGSMLVSLLLVRWLGARQARTAAQMVTMMIAALFFISIQLMNLAINADLQARSFDWLEPLSVMLNHFGAESWLWFPVKAFFFDGLSLLKLWGISGGMAWLTVEVLNRQFIASTQEALTTKRSPIINVPCFRRGINCVFLMKEWRVILRSPYLLSRTLLSVVFLVPLVVWILYGQNRGADIDLINLATTGLPTTGAFLTSSLAAICIAGEEAPDLIRLAPVSRQRIRLLKLLAILLPVWTVLLGVFILLGIQGIPIITGIGLTLLSTACTALTRLWNARPQSQSDMMMRRRETAFKDTILGILESLLFFIWVVLGTQVRRGDVRTASVVLLVLAIMMAIAYWRSRTLQSSFAI